MSLKVNAEAICMFSQSFSLFRFCILKKQKKKRDKLKNIKNISVTATATTKHNTATPYLLEYCALS